MPWAVLAVRSVCGAAIRNRTRVIYLHKILPALLMPTTIAVALMIAGLLVKRRSLCWTGLALAWTAATPIVSSELMRAAEEWQTRAPVSGAPTVSAIVVLSQGLVRAPGDPNATEWLDPDRFIAGVELFKAGKALYLYLRGAGSLGDRICSRKGRFWPSMRSVLVCRVNGS